MLDYPLYIIITSYESIMKIISNISITLIFKKDLILVYFYYIILLLSIKNYKYLYLFLLIFTIHLNYNYIFPSNYVYFYDVGQGDSILISNNNNYTLIDTGGKTSITNTEFNKSEYNMSEKITIPVLKSLGISKINNLILTHGDEDHMKESINLVKSFSVDKVIFNTGEINNLESSLIDELNIRNIPYYQNVDKVNDLIFLYTKEYDNENDNSNVIYLNIDNYKFLFMGDASYIREKDIIDKYNLINIDVLKVGHHGSKTSSSKEFISYINPKYSVISVGKNNKYGHPNKEVLNNLKETKIYRTDLNGSIMFKTNSKGLKILMCSP